MRTTVGKMRVVDVSLTVDTSIYADGDSLAEPQSVTAFLKSSGMAIIHELKVQDDDDNGAELDIIVAKSAITLSSSGENAAVDVSDADAAEILAQIAVTTTDYFDNINSQAAYVRNIGAFVDSDGVEDLFVGAISRGTPTYGGGVLKVRFGLLDFA